MSDSDRIEFLLKFRMCPHALVLPQFSRCLRCLRPLFTAPAVPAAKVNAHVAVDSQCLRRQRRRGGCRRPIFHGACGACGDGLEEALAIPERSMMI